MSLALSMHDPMECEEIDVELDEARQWQALSERKAVEFRARAESAEAEVERLRGERDAAQEHVAYHLRDYALNSELTDISAALAGPAEPEGTDRGRRRGRAVMSITWDPEAEARAVADARAKDVIVGVVVGIVAVAVAFALRGLQLWACGL